MPAARTIQLFLMDGTPQKRMKASLSNWTGVAYLLPRNEIPRSAQRSDLHRAGVYLLFGTNDEEQPTVYVGQARVRKNSKGVLGRLAEHMRPEADQYWTHAVVLVTSNDTLGPTEISYLENQFTNLAQAAGRYTVLNRNEPSSGAPTEEKQAELDEFIEYSRMIVGALGYKVFEPKDDSKIERQERPSPPELHLRWADSKAVGRQTSDGFVVLAGSQLRDEKDFTRSAPASARKNRHKYAKIIDGNNTLTADALFLSPSAAASFVCGASANGWTEWKDARGLTLKELETESAERL